MTFRLIRALKRQPIDRTPVWVMRQAGRYLPEYRAIREKVGHFLGMCKNPEIAAEVTLQPLTRFDLDAAIIFSDILTIPDAMGLGLSFKEGEGPHFERLIRDQKAVDQLPLPDPEEALGYVMQAIRLVKTDLKEKEVPLIGFCGSPWTVATYMVEGKSSRFAVIKAMMYQAPEIVAALLAKLTAASILYLKAQIAAGADVAMIFDTWGGILTPSDFRQFSLAFMQEIVSALRADSATQAVPIILFTKQGGGWLEMLAETGCDALGLDWTQDIGLARQRVGHRVALQGNLDPTLLYAPPARIQEEVKKILTAYGQGSGHVFNLGHGILPDVSPERVQVMIEAVHQFHAG